MELKSCTYYGENGTIDVIARDGSKMTILCAEIEDSMHTTLLAARSWYGLKTMNRPHMRSSLPQIGYRTF